MSQSPARARRKPVKLFYCGTSFYVKNLHKEWMLIPDGVAKHYLIRAGFRAGKSEASLTEADNQLLTVRERDCVSFAGPIAGQRSGLLVYNGKRMLVTAAPELPIAKKGSFPLWDEILSTQYGDKLPLLLEWHRQAYLRVLNGGGPLLPALAVAGATGVGKTLVGAALTRPLLGGRMANPVMYMRGESSFNADVCGSETLLLDDIPSRMQKDSLDSFQGVLKQMIAAPFDTLHAKGREALSVPVVRAVLICMNAEAHNFRILPLDDTDLDDKLMLLHVLKRPVCLPQSHEYEKQLALGKALAKEIPHLLWHLLNDFKMPKALRWVRGEPCFRAPELLAKAFENDAVSRVLWLFDKVKLLSTDAKTAHEWDEWLRGELGALAGNILDNGKHPLNLGHLLRSAANRFPGRVVKAEGEGHGGVSKWVVKRAAGSGQQSAG